MYIYVVQVLSDCILTLLLGAFKFRYSVFGIFVFDISIVCFFYRVDSLMADLVAAAMRHVIM